MFGVKRGNRSSFKVWEEGKAPGFVLEVASPSTAENDAEHKALEYASIGVREYWRLDPTGSLMSSPLEGYVACAGSYDAVEPVAGAGAWLRSEELGLELRSARQAGATVVVFRDPGNGGGVRRLAGSGRAAAAGRRRSRQCGGAAQTGSRGSRQCGGAACQCSGEACQCSGGESAGIGEATPQPRPIAHRGKASPFILEKCQREGRSPLSRTVSP